MLVYAFCEEPSLLVAGSRDEYKVAKSLKIVIGCAQVVSVIQSATEQSKKST